MGLSFVSMSISCINGTWPQSVEGCYVSVIETIPGKFSIWFSYLQSELRISEQYHAALEPGGVTLS